MESPSEFPKFKDGDVTVVVSNSHIYQLHANALRRLSPSLARMIDEFPGAKLTAAARREGYTPYRLELRPPVYQEAFGTFERVPVSDNGKVMRTNANDPLAFLGIDNIVRGDGQEKYWEWLFGSFYNIPPKFEDHNLATVLHSCMGLVDAAETIEAINQIRDHVDLALMRQDQVLWRSIAANPVAWTELGCRLHSPNIFVEGVIHLVGLWQGMTEEERLVLRPEIRDLIDTKWQELDDAKRAIDMRILGHYPAFLCRNHTDKPHRTSYSSDIYMWMAISFFRHWYAQASLEGRNRVSPDGGFKFYNQLAQGGNAYLHHEDFQNFHQFFPMSSKACNVLEANMNVLKEEIKIFVKDLVKVNTRVKTSDFPIRWLTCAIINKFDLPWEHAGAGKVAVAQAVANGGLDMGCNDVGSSPLTPLEAFDLEMADFEMGSSRRV